MTVSKDQEKLRRRDRRYFISAYFSKFSNILLATPHSAEDEKTDRFFQGLGPQIRLEVMKACAQTMNNASRTALNVDAALCGVGIILFAPPRSPQDPVSMDIEIIEQHRRHFFRVACLRCKKEGCRI